MYPPHGKTASKQAGERPTGGAWRIVGWRASRLSNSTPQQLIEQLLPLHEPAPQPALQRALRLARDAGMSDTVVWQRVWAASDQTEAAVRQLAEAGSSAAAEVLMQLAQRPEGADVATVRALVHAVLQVRGADAQNGAVDGSDGATLQRLQLLHVSDMIDTFQAIHGGDVEVAALRDFAQLPVPDSAHAFASAGSISALQVLLERHPYSMGRAVLSALATLPAATPVGQYLPLLRLAADPTVAVQHTRDADACECADHLATAAVQDAIWQQGGPEHALRVIAERSPAGAHKHFCSAEEVDAWVLERACAIDDESGLALVSLSLLKAWAAQGRTAASAPAAALHMWLAVLRHSAKLSAEAQAALAQQGVRSFLDLTPPAQLLLVLQAALPADASAEASGEVVTEGRARRQHASTSCLQPTTYGLKY